MFKFLKKLFGFKRKIKRMIKEWEENNERYIAMSKDELAALPEDELFDAAFARTWNTADSYKSVTEGLAALNAVQRIFYVASYYEVEVNNGGLCQFFVNSSRYVAPELSAALEGIGALEHKKLYDDFIKEHGIDVTDLSSFTVEEASEFEAQYERYPFDEFDNAFYDMKPVCEYLAGYVKGNLDRF